MFISASSFGKLRYLKIFDAYELFVDELESAVLAHNIFRPNGFFSDMQDFLKIGQKVTAYLFRSSEYRLNSTHKVDLTNLCDNTSENILSEFFASITQNIDSNNLTKYYAQKPV